MRFVARQSLACLVAVMSLVALGCSDKTPNYTPRASVAQTAVERALDAWKAGLPVGEIPDTKPVIQVVDAGRKPGQTLSDYRILGEARGPSGRTFTVVLQLADPNAELKTQYIVVGIDPLWVFRREDYELLAHWDHHMPAQEPEGSDDER